MIPTSALPSNMERQPIDIQHYSNLHSRKDLSRILQQTTDTWETRTIIVGGHYMLVYRQEERKLVPLMNSSAKDWNKTPFEHSALEINGDFPEATFEFALQLVCQGMPGTRKIALVVNDVHFRRTQQESPKDLELSEMRRQYYRQSEVPWPFVQILKRYPQIDPADVFLENNDVKRPSDSLLPPRTFFFSERVLQKDFQRLRKELQKLPGFKITTGLNCSPKIVYEYNSGNRIVLSDCRNDEDCGCSAETVALLLNIADRKARNVIFFIPDECRDAVDTAIKVVLEVFACFDNVIAVWGDACTGQSQTPLKAVTFYRACRSST